MRARVRACHACVCVCVRVACVCVFACVHVCTRSFQIDRKKLSDIFPRWIMATLAFIWLLVFKERALLPLFSGLNVSLKREVKLNSINPLVSTGRLQSWNSVEMKQYALLSAGKWKQLPVFFWRGGLIVIMIVKKCFQRALCESAFLE